MNRTQKSVAAFTLIELLAVVAVVLLLLSLLVPTLSSARKRANLVPCMNNLRQLYSLCLGYAGDNNGSLPQGLSENPEQLNAKLSSFTNLLKFTSNYGYTAKIWYCPSFPNAEAILAVPAWANRNYPGPYMRTGTDGEFPIGYFYSGNPTPGSLWKYDVPPPASLQDLIQTNIAFIWDYCQAPRPSPLLAKDVPVWNVFPHHGGEDPSVCQFMMANGSVTKKKLQELEQRYHYIGPGEVYW